MFPDRTVDNDTELENYLIDYGYNGSKYKDLKINYDVNMDNIEIHSPCEIIIATGKVLTGAKICIDGRDGVENANGYTIDGTNVSLLSEQGSVILGSNSVVEADELLIQADKTAKIGSSSQVDVSGAFVIKSIGDDLSSNAEFGQSSVVNAGSVRVEAPRTASIGPALQMTVDDDLVILSTGTELSSSAEINISSNITASSLEMSADKTVEIGASSTVAITGALSMSSTGVALNSDAIIGTDAIVSASSFDMSSNNDALLLSDVEVNVTSNFYMNAATPSDCSISGTAVVTAGSESGNCLE